MLIQTFNKHEAAQLAVYLLRMGEEFSVLRAAPNEEGPRFVMSLGAFQDALVYCKKQGIQLSLKHNPKGV